MIGLPKTTEYNRLIRKRKLVAHLDIAGEPKKILTKAVKSIRWCNKIAATTTNIAPGKAVIEVEVFEIQLRRDEPVEDLLRLLDRGIPYHILFLLTYEGKYQARIAYKEAAAGGSAAYKVIRYYTTDWLAEDELPLRLTGGDMDAVYEHFVRQVAGSRLRGNRTGETLQHAVTRDETKQALQRQIARLQQKLRKEKQLNRQMEINRELKTLKRQWEVL